MKNLTDDGKWEYDVGYNGRGNKLDYLYERGMVRVQEAQSDENVTNPGFAYLPHSCDEWIIGGPENVSAMIADLMEVLAWMEAEK